MKWTRNNFLTFRWTEHWASAVKYFPLKIHHEIKLAEKRIWNDARVEGGKMLSDAKMILDHEHLTLTLLWSLWLVILFNLPNPYLMPRILSFILSFLACLLLPPHREPQNAHRLYFWVHTIILIASMNFQNSNKWKWEEKKKRKNKMKIFEDEKRASWKIM